MTTSWTKRLFSPAANPSSIVSVIRWWELRRFAFNVLVGSVGLVSFILNLWLWTTYIQRPGEDDGFGPVIPAIVFGILANVFYTSGWIVESLLLFARKESSQTLGPRLFALGLIFSLTLALLPGLLMAFAAAFKALRRL